MLRREELEGRLAVAEDFMERLWIEFNLAYIRDRGDDAVVRPVVNRLCPGVKPTTAREYMEK